MLPPKHASPKLKNKLKKKARVKIIGKITLDYNEKTVSTQGTNFMKRGYNRTKPKINHCDALLVKSTPQWTLPDIYMIEKKWWHDLPDVIDWTAFKG